MLQTSDPDTGPAPTLIGFAMVIARIGLTSFGGGLSGWLLRIVVQEKAWVSEADFLSGLAVCQVFPGVNVVNISIWLGYRLHGTPGAVVGPLAMVVPPAIIAIVVISGFAHVADIHWVQVAMNGAAAAAIGLGASMGLRAARRVLQPVPLGLMALTIMGVGVLRLPLLWVVLPLVPLAIGLAWVRE